MQAMIDAVIPSMEKAMLDVGIQGDFWRNMLSRSKEATQGDLALPCSPSPNNWVVLRMKLHRKSLILLNWRLESGRSGSVCQHPCFADLARQSNPSETSSQGVDSHRTYVCQPEWSVHVGRARNAVLGDTFVRMHRAVGYDVTAEYYVDDMGKQVGILCWALENLDEERVHSLLDEGGITSESSPHSDKHVPVCFGTKLQIAQGPGCICGCRRDRIGTVE